ncbi:tRNA U34 5-methylaminomethyl-2-thiouridine-forming methyltransferase MnmC [Palleronia marisminoris]|uniref:tRNA 5-methylaminomethyl-2-thiouridine biosynthesis bifunctional protein MnmC n=1 Tax=Palleronia marisminoris TaxID=315423 RepID=A0A1Y5SI48_9RHOB|nr:tRNA (5-methylaminomethyl-2-thiouridine)(34)-methyltransferase MnmD [Palleronia marisminoris]SFG82547.1 tRNA U34 5-methylaminomethyl-2-thiouridine-forming methyltransferase MnmC [Palleronia marisminoris]SLN40661.1 tRNA 5-methylaminomethyl-2-thiouridine biosynthesis bifunctional protein MnmC [Palleronia marisminoris]
MTAHENRETLDWRDGVPVSRAFDDPYFSLQDGLAETQHVFLSGNDLPARFRAGFHVAELGFGTGLNCAATLLAWRAAGVPGPLTYTSFEAFPLTPDAMARALAAFPALGSAAAEIVEAAAASGPSDLRLTVVEGDARDALPSWDGQADAWFLDGFAPARNPGLWTPELLCEVARHTVRGGTFATYTAAGQVRRDLAAAGFAVERVPGFGRKRHMTRGRLP